LQLPLGSSRTSA